MSYSPWPWPCQHCRCLSQSGSMRGQALGVLLLFVVDCFTSHPSWRWVTMPRLGVAFLPESNGFLSAPNCLRWDGSQKRCLMLFNWEIHQVGSRLEMPEWMAPSVVACWWECCLDFFFFLWQMFPNINTGIVRNNNIQSQNKQNRNRTCLTWVMALVALMQLKGPSLWNFLPWTWWIFHSCPWVNTGFRA